MSTYEVTVNYRNSNGATVSTKVVLQAPNSAVFIDMVKAQFPTFTHIGTPWKKS